MTFDCGMCPTEIHGTAHDALTHATTAHPGPTWSIENTPDGPLIVATYPAIADQLAA